MYQRIIKPIFDFCFALIVFLFLTPIFLIIVICLSIINVGNPFFFQLRPGINEKIFKIIKFKTMNDSKDSAGNLLTDGDRLTRIGKFLRKTSLDEIPQLINVIKGEMSFVGPRPLLPEYLKLYSINQNRRHETKPGITGWAQVNGRNGISWQKKFELDVWYVENNSFLLDLKIIFLTIKIVLLRKGINTQGQITTEAFKGN